MEKLIGRFEELKALKECYDSNKSEFVVIYGRRRIGKTFLVRHFCNNTFSFQYTGGHRLKNSVQLDFFAQALKKYGNLSNVPSLTNWYQAFNTLQDVLEHQGNEKKLIFIDEMPWIDNTNSEFVSALEMFWNSWATMRDDVKFIACGSATSWMTDKLLQNKGGLHNRITRQIYLAPFSLKECREYLEGKGIQWDIYQILECYMILGGVPLYYSLLDKSESLSQNIDRLFFKRNGELRNEYDELYYALFNSADKYIRIVECLASQKEGMTRTEIEEQTGYSGGGLTTLLNNLEKCDFIAHYNKIGSKSKNAIYKLIDFYTLFYLKFVKDNAENDDCFWTHHINTPVANNWNGLAFERVCMAHIKQIKRKLGIEGMATSAYSWRSNKKEEKAQVDLLIDRADRIINLCEIKFSVDSYTLTEDYVTKLRHRLSVFQNETKTRKSICYTFITTYGLSNPSYSSLVSNQVTAEDLFS